MDIGAIDQWANNYKSRLHDASPQAKILAAGMIVAAVVISGDLFVLLTCYLTVLALIVLTGLPASRIALIGAYPAVFAILFAFSRWDGHLITPAIIIVKALAAALAMLMLITTTPYPAIFASCQRVLPRLVGDGLLLTYRSLFILLRLTGQLWTALRLRGGLIEGRYVQNTRNIAQGIGLLMVRAFALSERTYDVMRLRGYSGRLPLAAGELRPNRLDLGPLSVGLALLALAIVSRTWPPLALFVGGYVLALALFVLAGSLLWVRLRPGARLVEREVGWRR